MPSKHHSRNNKNKEAAPVSSPQPSPSPATPAETDPRRLPMLGFAAPRASLSDAVRAVIDSAIAEADADEERQHLVVHMRKGLEQIERFMELAHTDVQTGVAYSDFETMVACQSQRWHNHVIHAQEESKEMHVQRRTLQDTLQLAMCAYDLKVGRPGRPDDLVYQKSEYARKYMPRGNCVAEWTSPTTGHVLYFPLVRAYRKFTGQEDDAEEKGKLGEDVLSKFFTKPMTQARHVISTTKENGEAAHLAVLKRSDGAYLFVVGSKNTHMVVTSLDDVDRACAAGTRENANPYTAAAPIARGLLRALDRLMPENRTFLCELLAQTRMTASFEMLSPSYQHVQLLDYLDEDTPVFYGLSFPSLDEIDGVEICVNPVLAYALVQSLGLRTVQFKVVPFTPDVMAQTLQEIRTAYQHEGAVNLFVDEEACVIGMEKFKTVWYVCLRAIREKAKSFLLRALPKDGKKKPNGDKGQSAADVAREALANSHKSLHKRFAAIQGYLDLTDNECAAYESLGMSFVTFLHDVRLVDCGSDKDKQKRLKEHVATMFPVAWKEFLDQTQLSDRIV
jgi:hypothetical protein